MVIEALLKFIDGSFGTAPAQPAPRAGISRRGLLGGAAAASATFAGLGVTAEPRIQSASHTAGVTASAPLLPHLPHVFAARSAADAREWEQFRARFIHPDGRVTDTGNQGVSHTESQGLGMLFAVAFDDRATFDRIWDWTATHLSRGSDKLHAWRYVPGAPNPVSDSNNASDGDIYIAGALSRASVLWREPQYLAASRAITEDLMALAVRTVGGRTVLLPGVYGFTKHDYVEVNLSYYVFPLLADLQVACPSPVLAKVIEDGRQLVSEARFGKRRLPPDWLRVAADGTLSVAPQRPARFSFDAVRIPLFLSWAGAAQTDLGSFRAFWGEQPAKAPAWVDLQTDSCAPYTASRGIIAIAMVTGARGWHAVDRPARAERQRRLLLRRTQRPLPAGGLRDGVAAA